MKIIKSQIYFWGIFLWKSHRQKWNFISLEFQHCQPLLLGAQSFTSLKAEHHHDINGGLIRKVNIIFVIFAPECIVKLAQHVVTPCGQIKQRKSVRLLSVYCTFYIFNVYIQILDFWPHHKISSWHFYKTKITFDFIIKGPIIYFFDSRYLSRHKQDFFN